MSGMSPVCFVRHAPGLYLGTPLPPVVCKILKTRALFYHYVLDL